ncbi:histidine phosphatase family protein [Mariniluteicoccus flavus]
MSDLQCPARLVLVRHGEAGHDLPRTLTLAGRGQSGAIADALRDDRVAGLWSSTMPRASQTASIIARELKLTVTHDDRLREFLMPEEDMPNHAVTGEELDATFAGWLHGDLAPTVYGESGDRVRDRLRAVVGEVADLHRGETAVLVSHGGIIQLGAGHLCHNLDADFVLAHPLPVAGSVVIDVDGSGWTCLRWNDLELG